MKGSVRFRCSLVGIPELRASSAARSESLIQTIALALLILPASKQVRIASVVARSKPEVVGVDNQQPQGADSS